VVVGARVGTCADRGCARFGDLRAGAQLVWANMMLHAVADPPALFERWERLLASRRLRDVLVPRTGDAEGTARPVSAPGRPVPTPDFIDMHDLGDMMVAAGFADPVMDQETLTLRWTDSEALLRELRALGRNTRPGRPAGLRTRLWRSELVDAARIAARPRRQPWPQLRDRVRPCLQGRAASAGRPADDGVAR
jgi:malonyl-CoA O-methyltransferase